MASLTRWTWVWVNSGNWWWTGRPGMLQFMGLQRVGHDWVTELNWTELNSAYKLNKQSDNIQPWCTPFPIWNQSVVPCPVQTVTSWPTCRFLRRQVRWSGIPISLRIFHSLFWSIQLKVLAKSMKQMFFGALLIFYDLVDVDNLISGSSAFSKSSLNIWKFTVHYVFFGNDCWIYWNTFVFLLFFINAVNQ